MPQTNILTENICIDKQEGRVKISESTREPHEKHPELFRATGQLIVHNLNKYKDAGIYKCVVEDQLSNRNSAVINVVKILGRCQIVTTIAFFPDFCNINEIQL